MQARPLVLLIDDDTHALAGFAELLEYEGFDIVVASSAEEARRRSRERAPDAVVTDIALPDGDGLELASDLRMQAGGRDMPILAMTAFWATDVHDRAARAGITAVLAKPCQPQHLVAELRRVLRGWPTPPRVQ